MAVDTLREAGMDTTDFVADNTDEELTAFGRELGGLWCDTSEELLTEIERTETPEQLRAFAEYLREIGASLKEPPSAAVRAFLDRHSPLSA